MLRVDWWKKRFHPFRTAVPFWGQTTQIPSFLSPTRDCSPKRRTYTQSRTNSSHRATRYTMSVNSRQGEKKIRGIDRPTHLHTPPREVERPCTPALSCEPLSSALLYERLLVISCQSLLCNLRRIICFLLLPLRLLWSAK